MDILMVPPNMKFCKLDYTILEDNILHLCSELNFVDIKTLKFPMCKAYSSGVIGVSDLVGRPK